MNLQTADPWMTSKDYARSLKALTVKLVVRDIPKAVEFQLKVLKTKVVYSNSEFAVVQGYGGEWMLHADPTYSGYNLKTSSSEMAQIGEWIELRLHGCDPDAAVAAAHNFGFKVLTEATDKPYELREAHLVDADRYIWVPNIPAKAQIAERKSGWSTEGTLIALELLCK
jgi:uncharacterized glyoxalase superfamily protein PhnB